MGETAQKISKVDKNGLLELLNTAFAEEWLAYYQYWIGAQVATGPMRITIIGEFLEHANEELEHAKKLSNRILQLGGTPIINPLEWEKKAKCKYEEPSDSFVLTLIEQNLQAERCAIARYQQICDMCHGKDYETFKLSEEILHEEIDHEQEMEDFLQDFQVALKRMENK